MPHYHLQGLENNWDLVRETAGSQKFKVTTPEGRKFSIDIHYTMPKLLNVTAIFVGKESELSKSILTPVFDDVALIALKRADYAVIDYTLCHTDELHDGNFTIDEASRRARSLNKDDADEW
jgi:hypothetical protein